MRWFWQSSDLRRFPRFKADVRNPYQVLREKESELEKVKREVEALRLVLPLLTEEETGSNKPANTQPEARKDATTGLKIPTQKWP
jgi:hypothetical protein